MIVKETHKGRNNKQFVYYRCTKCNTYTRADRFEPKFNLKIDDEATQRILDNFAEGINRFYKQAHNEATKRGIRAAKQKKYEANNNGDTNNSNQAS